MLLLDKTLIRMSKGVRVNILLIALMKLAVLAATAGFARNLSAFMGNMFNPVMTAYQTRAAIRRAFFASVIMLAGNVLVGEAEYRCTAKSRILLRDRIFSKMLELDAGNIEKIGPSRAVTDAVDGVEQMQSYYSNYLPGLIYGLVSPFYLWYRLKDICRPASLLMLVVAVTIIPVNNIYRKKMDELKNGYWGSFSRLNRYFLESLRSLTTVKLFNRENRRYEKLKEKAMDFKSVIMKVMKWNFSAFLITDLAVYRTVCVCAVMVCVGLRQGTVSLSGALMMLMMSYSFFGGVRSLMTSAHTALRGVAATENISVLMDMDTSRPHADFDGVKTDGFDGIRLKDVDFSYDGKREVLSGVNMYFEKGKMTAIAGPSGCGKSTVASLLMRFSDCDKGGISMEGRPYVTFFPDELRKNIAMVPQYVNIFTGSIEENLKIAKPDATRREMTEALKEARLYDWVSSLPDGIKTQVGDAGGKLSGGQRQKIGIARALLRDTPYVIFDESTSSVDMDSEEEIWSCINGLAPSRTPIVISHRLSTIEKADMIYVLDGGKIVGRGDHGSLMEQGGLYSRLVREQTELENHAGRGLSYGK